MEWEYIGLNLYRTKIPGGWIIKHESSVLYKTNFQGIQGGFDYRTSICFVPDEDHYWQIPKKDGA